MALECVDLTSQSDLTSENVAEYSEFKIKFNRQLTVFYESLTGNLKKAWTRARIADVIEYIKDGKEAMKAGLRRTPMQYYWCAKYDILNVDNEEYLIFKQNHKDDPAVRVVAIEDYFDLLLEIHRENGHGGRDKLCKIIKNKYYIQKKPIEIFIALCPTCEIKRNLPKKGLVSKPMVSKDLNSRGLVDIIDFRSQQDGDYKFLLNYQDNVTKFIQLRPLITNQAPEIASELVKIFLIFGAPYILQSDSGREFTAKILREMLKMLPQCKIVHGGPKPPPQTQTLVDNVEKSTSEDVKDMLSTWMRDNLSKSWSVGCHIVQYQMNASYHKTIGRSPYRALFGCDPKMGLQSLNIPEDVLKTINTEEDLEKNQLSDGSTSWQCSDNGTSVPAELSVEEPELASQPEPEPEPYGCHACNITFSGFVYECVQCEYRMCADCDHAGVHNEHYVLRVPAHSPREEVKEVVSKVRVALNLVELRPPPHAHKKHGRKRRARRDSDDGPPEVPVIVKMEVDIEEDDPLTFPRSPSPSPCPSRVKREPDAAVPSDGNMYAMLDTTTEPQEDILQVIIKSEPPDEAPSTSQLPTTDLRHAQQLDLQRSQPHPQPQTTDTPGKRGADSAAEGKKPKKGRLKKKVDT